jgi:hypothetical protein
VATNNLLRFSSSCERSDVVLVERALDEPGWLVITPGRESAWLLADHEHAVRWARQVAADLGVAVVSS